VLLAMLSSRRAKSSALSAGHEDRGIGVSPFKPVRRIVRGHYTVPTTRSGLSVGRCKAKVAVVVELITISERADGTSAVPGKVCLSSKVDACEVKRAGRMPALPGQSQLSTLVCVIGALRRGEFGRSCDERAA
jgi:hypothetical protein